MFIFFIVAFYLFASVQCLEQNATAFCYQCHGRRNPKDLYADPNDCHSYFQCFYLGKNEAVGYKRNCPIGTFWHENVLQCMPEGDQPCVDPCLNATIEFQGCYGDPKNCASYYVCSGGASYHFCCPHGTAFDVEMCNCDWSAVGCRDECRQQLGEVLPQPTLKPPTVYGNFCIDSWGNHLIPVPGDDKAFQNIDGTIIRCALGSAFSLQTCDCSVQVKEVITTLYKSCHLYLSFDGDSLDHSSQHLFVDVVSPARVSSAASARGSGSLIINDQNGGVEVPGFKLLSDTNFSTCFFFRCLVPPCIFKSGALVSNREAVDSQTLAYVISLRPNNVIRIEERCNASKVPLVFEVVLQPLPADAPSGFHQFCFVSTLKDQRIYLDRQLIWEVPVACQQPLVSCPLTIGNDQNYGSFQGYIDEYLSCRFDIGQIGVDAHWNGRLSLQAAGFVP